MNTCANCRYFAELSPNPAPSSLGECRLYPEPSLPKSRTWWCGQWDGEDARMRALETVARWVKNYGSKHDMPYEVFAILETIGD